MRRRSLPIRLLTAAALLLTSLSIAHAGSAGSKPEPEPLLVAVAASAVPAVEEIAREFTRESRISVTLSGGSSGALTRQAREGAPFDLFLSADMERVEQLARQGVVTPGSIARYARGVLVLWQPPGARPRLGALDDLASPTASRMRLALANPQHAPYGTAARTALQQAGLWTALESRVVYGEDVGQVYQIARSGNVDAAFLPLSLAGNRKNGGSWTEVPAHLHPPLLQGVGLMTKAPRPDAARRFREFLLSERGQAILSRHGYRPAR